MTKYTQSAASQEVPPPYHFPGVIAHAFVWEAPIGPIQRFCDTNFNLGDGKKRGFVYQSVPLWPYALLMFLEYPVMMSSSDQNLGPLPSYSERGAISQTEVFVSFPVMRYGTTPTKFLLNTNLEWTLPFIVVGNGMSAVSGREMLGIGKLLAKIKTSEGRYPGSFSGRVDLPGWERDGEKQKMMRFLEIDTGPDLPTFRGNPPSRSLWTLFQSREAGWGFDELATAADFIDNLSAGTTPAVMRTTSLRQVRDAKHPETALYQALVSSRSYYDNIRDFCFYNENDVCVKFNDTGSFARILRLFLDLPKDAANEYRDVPIKAAFQFKVDIDFDETRTIHTFHVDRPGLPPVPESSDLIAPWLRPWAGFFGRKRT